MQDFSSSKSGRMEAGGGGGGGRGWGWGGGGVLLCWQRIVLLYEDRQQDR